MEGGTVSNHAETRPPSMLSLPFLGGEGWEDEGKEQGREKLGKGEKGASLTGVSAQELCLSQGNAACRAKLAKPHAGAQQAGSSVPLPTPPGFYRCAQIPQAQCLESRHFLLLGDIQIQFTRAYGQSQDAPAREQDPNPIQRWAPSCHNCSHRCHTRPTSFASPSLASHPSLTPTSLGRARRQRNLVICHPPPHK